MAVLFTVYAIRQYVWMPWYANHVLFEVESRSRTAMDSVGSVESAVLARQSISELRKIAEVTRGDPAYYMLYAANARLIGDLPLAAQMYSEALEHADHRPEIYYERGLVYMNLGRLQASVDDLAHAARFNPEMVDDLSGDLRARVLEALQEK